MASSQEIGNECGAFESDQPTIVAYANRETSLGSLHIFRALPIRERRMVGPWCFLDRFGPVAFSDEKPMNVPPHPHIGLQTVSWLLEGEVRHTDSLNAEAIVRPGGVNVMTAGHGIAHAEETPPNNSGRLNGVQLWVALPDQHRETPPGFTHVEKVPNIESKTSLAKVFAGTLGNVSAPDFYFSDLLGAEITVHTGQKTPLELDPLFEHALLLLDGDGELEKQPLSLNTLYYLSPSRESLEIASQTGCKLLLIGGPPFPSNILMWWNFVARTPEEIRQAKSDWDAHQRFGDVKGTNLHRLKSPDLGRFASPNPAS